MPAAVTYQIKGKYDNTATKAAQSDLVALSKSIKAVGVAAWAKIGAAAVKTLNTVVSGATDTFAAQNKAVTLLNSTIKKSNKDFTELIKHQQTLSRNNFFDGDSINNAEAMAISMGLTEQQIIKVMDAAAELAAAGIMPLEQAAKELAKTYSGTSGSLGKMLPQIKDLTKEQLANGDAIDIIKDKYQGLADVMADTYSGKQTQFNNSFSDLQAAVGGIVSDFKLISMDELIPVLNKITDWLVENRDFIVNSILNLPSIVLETVKLIKNIIIKSFTGDSILNIFVALVKTTNQMIADTFTYIGQLADNFAVIFVNIITDLADSITKKIGEAFTGVSNGFDNALLDGLKTYAEKVFEVATLLLNPKKLVAKGMSKVIGSITSAKHTVDENKADGASAEEINKKYFGIIAENTTEFAQNYAENLKELGTAVTDNFSEEFTNFEKAVRGMITGDLPAVLEKARSAGDTTTTVPEIITTDTGSTSMSGYSVFGDELEGLAGISDALSGGLGAIFAFISSIENVNALLNPWQTILDELYETIAPVINEVLAPLVGILKTIGKTLGVILIPLIQSLTPVINLVSQAFTWLYNKIIVPVGNGFIDLFVKIKNAITTAINKIFSLLNKLPNVNIAQMELSDADSYHLQAITADDLAAAGAVSDSTTTGGSASFTAARDIIVNISFDRSFVNGDAMDIAIMLKEEIEHAERLGY